MTVDGTVNRTMLLMFLVVASSYVTWSMFFQAAGFGISGMPLSKEQIVIGLQAIALWVIVGAIAGLLVAFLTIFKKTLAPITAPIYALLQGLFVGGISAVCEAKFPGIVLQAVALTFGTLFCLLLAYRSKMIKATENFKLGVTAATGSICLIYVATFIGGLFGIKVPYIHDSGVIGIGFSLFVVAIAALNLVLDFDFIENGATHGAPKYMEWYGAFGLMVTLVWLYLEILRLLSKMKSED